MAAQPITRAAACALVAIALGCSSSTEPTEPGAEPRVAAPTVLAESEVEPPAPEPAEPAVEPAAEPAVEAEEAPSADTILAARATTAPTIDGALDDDAWTHATAARIDRDWHGESFDALETRVRIVWTEGALFLAFDGTYLGEIDAPDAPEGTEYDHLYGHDALEVFLDPDPSTPGTYRELELGPRGHFLDVAVDRSARPRGDVAWSSGLSLASRVDEAEHRFTIEARVPSTAFGPLPLAPGELRIGLYRIARVGDERAFLARFPTGTTRPNFHVPERFGRLRLTP